MTQYSEYLQKIVAFARPWDATAAPAEAPCGTIDAFLKLDDYRIVADNESVDIPDEITITARFDDDELYETEELAEVYLAQGLTQQAVDIYRRLSLVNPEKSAYFAQIITQIENYKTE